MALVGIVIAWVLQIYMIILFVRVVLSWIPLLNPRYEPKGLALVLFELVYSLTDPPIKLVRALLPPGPRMGGVRLDLGFLVVFVALMVLMWLNALVFLR